MSVSNLTDGTCNISIKAYTLDTFNIKVDNMEQSADTILKKNASNELIWEPKSGSYSYLKYQLLEGPETITGSAWAEFPNYAWVTESLSAGDYILEVYCSHGTSGSTINDWGAVKIEIGSTVVCESFGYTSQLNTMGSLSSFIRLPAISGVQIIKTYGKTGATSLTADCVRYKLYMIKSL